jgi:hypothetical protein
VAIKPNIADRVKKGQGASVYFQEEEKALPQVGTQPEQDTPPDKEPETPPQPEPQPDKGTAPGTVMGTDTELQQFLKPSDNYVRKVYYPLDYQEEYIKKKAKRYKKTESEILRFLLDFAIKNGKI